MMFPYQSDTRYCDLIQLVIFSEGGYTAGLFDPGGPTKYGIATNYNKEALKVLGVMDIKNLTMDQARQIYYDKYWLASHANTIPDKRLAYIHLDTAVNEGVGKAMSFLANLGNDIHHYSAGDGKNDALWLRLCIKYDTMRKRHYTALVGQWSRFGRGWINRLADVMARIVAMSLMLCLCPASAADLNNAAHLAALVRSDRQPRSWKTLWLKPGKPTFYYYEWIQSNGAAVIKIETVKLKHVPDRRSLRDSHPNLAIIIPAGNMLGSTGAGTMLTIRR